MVPQYPKLRSLDPAKDRPRTREEQLYRLSLIKAAQLRLEAHCKEKGIPVPIAVC